MDEYDDDFGDEFDGMRDYTKLPIYIKGRELAELAFKLADVIDDENEHLTVTKEFMRSDAILIPANIARAEGAGFYDIRMESAAIIRKSAMDLRLHCHTLREFGFKEPEYLDLIREEVEEFRELFIDWVAGFDPWEFYIDRWGLFNPPGVDARDPDPDSLDGGMYYNPDEDDFDGDDSDDDDFDDDFDGDFDDDDTRD